MQLYDVAIIGGGLVGASFARSIANLGLNAILIDRVPAADLCHPSLDNRGLAISYTTKQILTHLDLWPAIDSKAFAFEHVHVSERHGFGFTKISAASYKLPALGYVISASNLGLALTQGLETLPSLTILRPAEISHLNYDAINATWQLLVNEQAISAKLIVAADGSNSIVRTMQGITINVKDYAQTAIVCNVRLNNTLTTAYERFTTAGVLALLPFGACQAKCIWTVPNANLADFTELSDTHFLAQVQTAIGYRLGKFNAVDGRKIFPIHSAYVEQLYGNSMVLLGNAANTLHPVAAQGFNLGIRDAMCLARVLQQAKSAGQAINSVAILKKYAELRAIDHRSTRGFSNSLVEIFAHDLPLLKMSRKFGLVAAELLPGLKSKILARGMGTWM